VFLSYSFGLVEPPIFDITAKLCQVRQVGVEVRAEVQRQTGMKIPFLPKLNVVIVVNTIDFCAAGTQDLMLHL